jgi:crotonobetainyl-CoA:carnitine CoA-transferase CaiB-like acyl-CoA transferase
MLANLGARVIKVEEPELGDPLRGAPPFRRGRSVLAESLLSGVESIALDLKREGGREVLGAMLDAADVLLETFRPGALARLGFSPAVLRQERPRLVICSISGWGSGGPDAGRSGHDLSYQARAGALAPTGRMPNVPSADLQGAWSAVSGICAALFSRERTGRGAWIDASLFDAAIVGNVTNIAAGSTSASPPDDGPPTGPLTGALPCYRLYRTADRKLFALAALEERFWRIFCEAAGRSDLVSLQYRREPAAHRAVAEVMATRTADEWAILCDERDLPGEVVATPAEALAGEQAIGRGLAAAGSGGIPYPALLEGERPQASAGFPRLGQHTRGVLREFSPDRLEASRRERIAAGIGPRLSLRRSVRGWVGALKG